MCRTSVLSGLAVAALLFSLACSQQTSERTDSLSFKGVELYSWRDSGGELAFALLPGTNRLKTEDEIRAARLGGLTALEAALAGLARGEHVGWRNAAAVVEGEPFRLAFAYPDTATLTTLERLAKELEIRLYLPPEAQKGLATRLVRESGCDPERQLCLCTGFVEPGVDLGGLGLTADAIARGVPCVDGDFDGNGELDFALPAVGYDGTRHVSVGVLFLHGGKVERIATIDRVASLRRYPPREAPGGFGEPPSPRAGLVEWGEGGDTRVFLYDGAAFVESRHPSEWR